MKRKSSTNRILEIEKYFFSQGKVYLNNRVQDLKEIQTSLKVPSTPNLEKIKRIGHNIKGSAGLYGFSELSEIGFKIENTVQSGDIKNLSTIVDELQSFLNEAEKENSKS